MRDRAVNEFCVGGGVGLVGSDVIVASGTYLRPARTGTGRAGRGHAPRGWHLMRRLCPGGHRGREAACSTSLGAVVSPQSDWTKTLCELTRGIAAKEHYGSSTRRQGALDFIDVQRVNAGTGWSRFPSSSASPESPTSGLNFVKKS